MDFETNMQTNRNCVILIRMKINFFGFHKIAMKSMTVNSQVDSRCTSHITIPIFDAMKTQN